MNVGKWVEFQLAVETDVLGEIPSQCHFSHHKSHRNCLGIEHGPLVWKDSDDPPELWQGPVISSAISLKYLDYA
jgi:hypothetical protein